MSNEKNKEKEKKKNTKEKLTKDKNQKNKNPKEKNAKEKLAKDRNQKNKNPKEKNAKEKNKEGFLSWLNLSDIALSAVVPDSEMQKLDNQLCFALYVCSKEAVRKYKPYLDPLGLTYTGYITMMCLWEKDGVNVKELGKRLFLDSGTLTPLLKKLEGRGYVERKRDSHDERNMIVSLTEKGQELKKEAADIPRNLLKEIPIGNAKALLLLQTLQQLMEEFSESEEKEKQG